MRSRVPMVGAHSDFTRINIEPIIRCKKIEERHDLGAIRVVFANGWSQEVSGDGGA